MNDKKSSNKLDVVNSFKSGFNKSKASIRKDVEEVAIWGERRNNDIKNEKTKVEIQNMPTLAKVVFGGKDGMSLLSDEDREKYKKFFSANGKRLALLTVVNPAAGIGITGIEMAMSGLITDQMAKASMTAGAGIVAASVVAGGAMFATSSLLYGTPLLYTATSVLWPIGLGLLGVGTASRIISNSENSAIEKQLVEVHDESQQLWNTAYNQFAENAKVIAELLTDKLNEAIIIVEDVSKKAAITVDDIVHSNQNERLMQFQEIILKYQREITEERNTFTVLTELYNKKVQQNEQLSKQMAALQANKQLMACASEYLR